MKKKAKMGRPLKFENPEDMQKAIDRYFLRCDSNTIERWSQKAEDLIVIARPIPYTIEGLCAVLEMDRQTLLNYQAKDDFFGIIKRTKEEILANQTEMALSGESDKTMTIFLLKNNQGYADKTEQIVTGELSIGKITRKYIGVK